MNVESTQLHAVVGASFSKTVHANCVPFLQVSVERPRGMFSWLLNQSICYQWQMPITFRRTLIVKHFMDFHTYIAQPAIIMSDCPFIPKLIHCLNVACPLLPETTKHILST